METDVEEGLVNGLAGRLRQVEGVKEVHLDVGEGGIDAIRVRLAPETDEAEVLDEIHRLLAAYGLRTRKVPVAVQRGARDPLPAVETGHLTVEAVPIEGELEVRLRGEGRAVIRRGSPTPEGAVGAMASAVAGWQGRDEPAVGGVSIRRIGDHRVVTVVLEHRDQPRAGASIVDGALEKALHHAVVAAFPPAS